MTQANVSQLMCAQTQYFNSLNKSEHQNMVKRLRDIGEKGQGEESAPSDSRQRESGTEALRAHSVGCIIISLYANFVGLEGQSARWKATRWSVLDRSTDGIHVVSILRSRYRHIAGCCAVGAGAKLLQDASCSMASFHASVGSERWEWLCWEISSGSPTAVVADGQGTVEPQQRGYKRDALLWRGC